MRNTINSVGEEGQRDHRNDEQAVPRRADEKEKRKDNRQHGQNNQPTAVGIAPELIGFAQRPESAELQYMILGESDTAQNEKKS